MLCHLAELVTDRARHAAALLMTATVSTPTDSSFVMGEQNARKPKNWRFAGCEHKRANTVCTVIASSAAKFIGNFE
jgi:hypothetical protein